MSQAGGSGAFVILLEAPSAQNLGTSDVLRSLEHSNSM